MSRVAPASADPGTAAHSAKNAHAAPGLPNHSRNDSKGRTPMVGKARARISTAAARLAVAIDDELVTYTPQALNELISTVVAREVAGRLRERAAWHREQAAKQAEITRQVPLGASQPSFLRSRDHHREADALEALALRELDGIGRGES